MVQAGERGRWSSGVAASPVEAGGVSSQRASNRGGKGLMVGSLVASSDSATVGCSSGMREGGEREEGFRQVMRTMEKALPESLTGIHRG